jgi:hypothetical protein
LFASGKWDSCLRCHDFHGNHQIKLVTTITHQL